MPVCSSRLPNTLQSLHMRDDFPFTQLSQRARLADTSRRDKNVVPIGVVTYSGKFGSQKSRHWLPSAAVFCAEHSSLIGFGWSLLDCRFWTLLWTKVLLIHQRRVKNGNLQGSVLGSKF